MSQICTVDAPQALPGRCYFCGTAEPDRGPYLDFGINMEGYGVLYACKQDITAIGRLYGLLDPVSSGDLLTENTELYLKNVELTDRVKRLEAALVALKETGLFNGDNPSSSLSDPVDPTSNYVPVLDEPDTEDASGSTESNVDPLPESNSSDAESLRDFNFDESGDDESPDDENVGELCSDSDGDADSESFESFDFDLSL